MMIACLFAMAGEVQFKSITFNEAIKLAQAQNKLVYIDCMTEWCSWCKVMDKKTFTNEEVAAVLNEKYISLKIDMEKGYGVNLAMKYHITSFPTTIIINGNGELVYKQAGYQDAEACLNTLLGVRAGDWQMKFPGISNKVDLLYPDFYKQQFINDKSKPKPSPTAASDFLAKQKDLFSETCWSVMYVCNVNEKTEQHFLDYLEKYRSLYGNETTDMVDKVIQSRLGKAITENSLPKFELTQTTIEKYCKAEDVEAMKRNASFDFYFGTQRYKEFEQVMSDYLQTIEYNNAQMINNYAWQLYENCEEKEVLIAACGWIENTLKYDSSYPILDTYAALFYKTNQKEKAKEAAEKAIAVGTEAKEDVSATVELLKKIEALK